MIAVMILFFLLQVFQRFAQHVGYDTNAGYHKQKVRHGFHLLPVSFRDKGVKPALCLSEKPTVKLYHVFYSRCKYRSENKESGLRLPMGRHAARFF